MTIMTIMTGFKNWIKLQETTSNFMINVIDPEEDWEEAEQVYQIAQKVKIRPSRNKDVSIIAKNSSGEVVGGIFSSFTLDDDMSQQAGKSFHSFEYDVVVDPLYQRQGVGKLLIQAAENLRHELASQYDTNAYTQLQVVNPNLHQYLTQKKGYDVDYEPPEGSKDNFMSILRKWMKK